jgi:four helix bundle protein
MATIKHFEDLEIWKKAIALADELYELCMNDFLKKDFSMQDQLKRAALSISNNIAEGFEYNNNADFIKFLRYSKGSCGECRSMIGYMRHKNWIEEDKYQRLHSELVQLGSQIGSFMSYLKSRKTQNNKPVVNNS